MLTRSLLFVPALRPERVAKAVAAGADIVCIDLEDSVAPDRKADGPPMAIEALHAAPPGATIAVRINPIPGDHGPRYAAALAGAGAKPAYVVLPEITRAPDTADT